MDLQCVKEMTKETQLLKGTVLDIRDTTPKRTELHLLSFDLNSVSYNSVHVDTDVVGISCCN